MQKVWEELKTIEAQAEKIQTDAQEKSKAIVVQAQKDAEQLIANSNAYAEEELKKCRATTIEEANKAREEKLSGIKETSAEFRANAEKNMDKAVIAILDAVLEEM